MAITKCLISAQTVNRFTVTARALRQRGRTGDRMVRAGLMEKTMRTTTEHSEASFEDRKLTDAELDLVTGGQGGGGPMAMLSQIMQQVQQMQQGPG
jgi:hypothetical protein